MDVKLHLKKGGISNKLLLGIFSLFIFIALIFFLYKLFSSQPVPAQTPSPVPNTLGATAKSGPDTLYPNPSLTPGEVFPNVTADQVCVSGYSSTVRNVPVVVKKQVYDEYGLSYPQAPGDYEVDHFISLELGGDNSIKNLWPEPANPTPGFHQKDMVENYLHKQVCDGKITLQEAQNEIQTDWYKVFLSIK